MVGPIVGSTFISAEGHRLGLYVAWHLGQPWYGDVRPASLEAYKNSGARFTSCLSSTRRWPRSWMPIRLSKT